MEHEDDDKTVAPIADAKKMSDNLRNSSMTSLCKKAITWFWLWPFVGGALGLVMAMFGIGSAELMIAIPFYAAPFMGFGFLLMAIKKRAQMGPFLRMMLIVGLVFSAPGLYQLAQWIAAGLLATKLQWGYVASLSELPVLVPLVRLQPFIPYMYMTMPPILLLLLIVPHFLALPVYWLWVVLSVSYVVLPARAWKWTEHALHRAWTAVRRTRET